MKLDQPHYCADCDKWFYNWEDLCGCFLKAYEAFDYDPKDVRKLIPADPTPGAGR